MIFQNFHKIRNQVILSVHIFISKKKRLECVSFFKMMQVSNNFNDPVSNSWLFFEFVNNWQVKFCLEGVFFVVDNIVHFSFEVVDKFCKMLQLQWFLLQNLFLNISFDHELFTFFKKIARIRNKFLFWFLKNKHFLRSLDVWLWQISFYLFLKVMINTEFKFFDDVIELVNSTSKHLIVIFQHIYLIQHWPFLLLELCQGKLCLFEFLFQATLICF